MGRANRLRGAFRIAGLVLGVGAFFWLGSAEAWAGDEFEKGFKREIGRIAAHEAVHGGRHVLAAIVLGYPPHVQGVAHHSGYDPYEDYPPRGRHHHDGHRHRCDYDDDSDSDSDSDRRHHCDYDDDSDSDSDSDRRHRHRHYDDSGY